MKLFKLTLALSFILLSCSNRKDSRTEKINQILSALHIEERFNGNILIAERGEIIYEKSFGLANLESGVLLNSESIFNIASVSKTFTAASIMLLEERGLLNLKDTITMYFPDFPYKDITIKNLMTHTSGLYRIQSNQIRDQINLKGLTNIGLMNVYQSIKPTPYFKPSNGYKYANTNYLLLALIIEKVSKLPFHVFIKKNIFDKAGMKNTFLKKARVPKSLQNTIVSYYRKPKWLSNNLINVDSIQEDRDEKRTFINNYGESGIHTTTNDLLKYHTALQNGAIINHTSLSKMYNPIILNNKDTYVVNPKSNYPSSSGHSWRVANDSSAGKIVFHAGGIRGGRSFFIRNITKDQVIIMLTNNELTDRHTFTTPMRILNEQSYEIDKKSLPREFAKAYLKNGIHSAIEFYKLHQNDLNFKPFIDWDFEEIGAEFIEKRDYKSAIKLFKLYTEKYPQDEFSWSLLGDANLHLGDENEALQNYKKSLNLNPENEHAIKMVKKLQS